MRNGELYDIMGEVKKYPRGGGGVLRIKRLLIVYTYIYLFCRGITGIIGTCVLIGRGSLPEPI